MGTNNEGFKILSHAGLCAYNDGVSVVTDPWVISSCYWKSWYNYPPLPNGMLNYVQNANAIYITHVHWDHWHGLTLKKVDRNKLIVTHDEPHNRSIKDLRDIGFKNIVTLKHGESIKIEDKIRLTAYQFGLYLNDSAVVIETDNLKLLDANDAKIAGLPLKNLIKNHGQFDFALRSHSSANDRVCYTVNGSDLKMDDNDHYVRSFKYFMDAVKPKYAVPFASNHCHLHPEVIDLNKIINNPFLLKKRLEEIGGIKGNTETKLMLPGDDYSLEKGFEIEERSDYYDNIDVHIQEYLKKEQKSIDNYISKEKRVKSLDRIFHKYVEMIGEVGNFHKRGFKDLKLDYLVTRAEEVVAIYEFEPYAGKFKEVEKAENPVRISIPAIILRDCVFLNMFHHAQISKRLRYECDSEKDFYTLQSFLAFLGKIELGFLPIRSNYLRRLAKTYVRRWREILTYFQAFFFLKMKKLPIYLVEEEILKRT